VNKIAAALATVTVSLLPAACGPGPEGDPPTLTVSTATSYLRTTAPVPSLPGYVIESGPQWDPGRTSPWFRCVRQTQTETLHLDREVPSEVWRVMTPMAQQPGVPCPSGLDRSER
jgi:hypothetical protein